MQRTNVFRKISLERLSSPEQLDLVLRITTPRGWIALAAIALLIIAGLVWGVAGRISVKVAGQGMLVRSGGVLEIVAPAAGRVNDVAVSVGDSITEGQVVARVAQPDLRDQVERASARLDALRIEHTEAVRFANRDALLQRETLDRRRANLEQSIAATEKTLRWLAGRIDAQQALVAQGLLTKATLLATRQQHEQARERIRGARSELSQLDVQRLAIENHRRETIRNGEIQVEQAEAELERLQNAFALASRVVSPYTGRVLEVMTEQGKIVGRGEPVLSLDLTGRAVQDLVAIIYVPSAQGKQVKPGMRVQVAPTTVRQEEFGMMLGEVTFVSDFPATPRGMLRVLKNEQLVRALSGGGAPYEVHAELIVDPETPSGYRWSSSEGPPIEIQSGTVAFATVAVESQRPIAKVIPLLRRWTGI